MRGLTVGLVNRVFVIVYCGTGILQLKMGMFYEITQKFV